jgi:hypothetical protein
VAVERAVFAEASKLKGKMVLVRADAVTTVRYVNKGSGPSIFLSAVMRRIWDLCIQHGIALVAEHIPGVQMVGVGVDSMSRAAEFSVAPSVFRHLDKQAGFGCGGGHSRYTVDLFASVKTKKCKRFACKGGGEGSIGDARTLKLNRDNNYWVCPPLPVIVPAVMQLVERKVRATVIVPNWPSQAWFVKLRQHAVRSMELKWHERSPVMFDVADKQNRHVHAVDKFDFVAFVLDGGGPLEIKRTWPERKQRSSVRTRRKVVPELRRKKVKRRMPKKKVLCKAFRKGKILSVCDGISVVSLCLERMQTPVEVTASECDEACRRLTRVRFPQLKHGLSDVNDVADKSQPWFDGFDLLVGGFPCQDVSTANKGGAGLSGDKSSLFWKVAECAHKTKRGGGHFILECTDFVGNHTEDFRAVGVELGVSPVILCASDVSAGYRRRAYWASFPISGMGVRHVDVNSVLEVGRVALGYKLPTVMASGVNSWNTAKVVMDLASGEVGPLTTVEMERQMGLPDGFTWLDDVSEKERHKQVGNAFHAYVMQHILECWIRYIEDEWDFDSTKGFPGEGPQYTAADWGSSRKYVKSARRRERVWKSSSKGVAAMRRDGRVNAAGRKKGVQGKRKAGKVQAAWRQLIPTVNKTSKVVIQKSVMDELGGASKWGLVERTIIKERSARLEKVVVVQGDGYAAFVQALRKDFVLSARSEATWKAYRAWVTCFGAFLESYGLSFNPVAAVWEEWVEVLADSVALLGICYSMGSVDVYVSAVSAFMQDGGMQSPFGRRQFKMLMEGMRRYKGMGKKKKPPVEAKHVAWILQMKKPGSLTLLQFIQATVIVLFGWQLFNRAQDFEEFDLCDFEDIGSELVVTVRYAKNDPRGLTRTARMQATGGTACPVGLWRKYTGMMGLRRAGSCDKVKGEPQRCSCCGPAFPSVWKKGRQSHRMPKSQVTLRIRALFVAVAENGRMTMDEALQFSAKSLRCGGVSQAAGEAVRDGVLQGHGGWLQRTSLRHYDLMRESEGLCVSGALNAAVERWRFDV